MKKHTKAIIYTIASMLIYTASAQAHYFLVTHPLEVAYGLARHLSRGPRRYEEQNFTALERLEVDDYSYPSRIAGAVLRPVAPDIAQAPPGSQGFMPASRSPATAPQGFMPASRSPATAPQGFMPASRPVASGIRIQPQTVQAGPAQQSGAQVDLNKDHSHAARIRKIFDDQARSYEEAKARRREEQSRYEEEEARRREEQSLRAAQQRHEWEKLMAEMDEDAKRFQELARQINLTEGGADQIGRLPAEKDGMGQIGRQVTTLWSPSEQPASLKKDWGKVFRRLGGEIAGYLGPEVTDTLNRPCWNGGHLWTHLIYPQMTGQATNHKVPHSISFSSHAIGDSSHNIELSSSLSTSIIKLTVEGRDLEDDDTPLFARRRTKIPFCRVERWDKAFELFKLMVSCADATFQWKDDGIEVEVQLPIPPNPEADASTIEAYQEYLVELARKQQEEAENPGTHHPEVIAPRRKECKIRINPLPDISRPSALNSDSVRKVLRDTESLLNYWFYKTTPLGVLTSGIRIGALPNLQLPAPESRPASLDDSAASPDAPHQPANPEGLAIVTPQLEAIRGIQSEMRRGNQVRNDVLSQLEQGIREERRDLEAGILELERLVEGAQQSLINDLERLEGTTVPEWEQDIRRMVSDGLGALRTDAEAYLQENLQNFRNDPELQPRDGTDLGELQEGVERLARVTAMLESSAQANLGTSLAHEPTQALPAGNPIGSLRENFLRRVEQGNRTNSAATPTIS